MKKSLKYWIKEILKTTEIEVDDNCNTSVILNNAETEIFSCSEFGNLTVLEIDNEPWFVGKEVADRLGYSNTNDAIRKHVDEEDKGVAKCDTLGGKQNKTNNKNIQTYFFSWSSCKNRKILIFYISIF